MSYNLTVTVSIDEVLKQMSQGELEGLARDLVDSGYGRYVNVEKAIVTQGKWEEANHRLALEGLTRARGLYDEAREIIQDL